MVIITRCISLGLLKTVGIAALIHGLSRRMGIFLAVRPSIVTSGQEGGFVVFYWEYWGDYLRTGRTSLIRLRSSIDVIKYGVLRTYVDL